MGTTSVIPVVADAGPLIHLQEIDALQFLASFDPLYVPEQVWEETVGHGRVHTDNLRALSSLRRVTVSHDECDHFVATNALHHLHLGERACLALCARDGINTLLTDDLAVRDAAKQLGVQPVGSLGVIIRAFHMHNIEHGEAETLLRRLQMTSSLFVTDTIVEMAIERLRSDDSRDYDST